MNAAQRHRGPDGSGVYERPELEAALGHVRLAVLDLSELAAQPMVSPDGRYVLVYNGEIYNFGELRRSLPRNGTPRLSSGDTEVLLCGLERFGPRFVERLNGMFAFALWDNREQELLLARDPLGIKPLYYAEPIPGSLLFASEMKALCAHPDLEREPDFPTIEQHLTFCHSCSDRTAIKGIRRVPSGKILRWKAATRRLFVTEYGESRAAALGPGDRGSDVTRLRHAVEQATERQLVADVPLGSFLSGGLDSSLITAIAARHSPPSIPFRSYTISYPTRSNRLDQAHPDAPYARKLAAALGLDFHEIEIGPEVAGLLPDLLYHLDEPLADPAVISCYLICRLARRHGTKVMLSGQGADELFGGYPRYAVLRALRWIDRVPVSLRTGLSRCAPLLPGALGGRGGATIRRMKRVLHDVHRPPDSRFLAYCMSTAPEAARGILHGDVSAGLNGHRPDDDCLAAMQIRDLTGIDRFLARDLSVYLPNHNLLYTDKMGMAVGVETRVPLLDRQLVELAGGLSIAQKLDPVPKAVLRQAARGLVPDAIIDRPKAGFGAPYRHWLRHDLAPLWNDLMNPTAIRRRGWFSSPRIAAIREQSQSGRADYYMLQWAALTLELWAREFIDGNPAQTGVRPADRRPLRRQPVVRAA